MKVNYLIVLNTTSTTSSSNTHCQPALPPAGSSTPRDKTRSSARAEASKAAARNEGRARGRRDCDGQEEMSDETKQLCSNAYTCEWCGAYSTIHTCSGCKEARYCGKSCQASHWAEHRGFCQQIQAERAKKENRKKLGEALYGASLGGKAPEVRTLLASGADPRYRVEEGQNKGYFPLFAASGNGHVDVIEALVAAGADPNQVGGKFSFSSLYIAAQNNQPRAIAALVRAGADVNLANSEGRTPLCCAAFTGHREALVALLVARAAVNVANNKGASPLYCAAQQGHVDILKLLIKAKGDVNQCEKEGGSSPLMIASMKGLVEAVELLLSNGADVHLKDINGQTALDAAIECKQPAVEAVLRAHIAHIAKQEAEAARERGGEAAEGTDGK